MAVTTFTLASGRSVCSLCTTTDSPSSRPARIWAAAFERGRADLHRLERHASLAHAPDTILPVDTLDRGRGTERAVGQLRDLDRHFDQLADRHGLRPWRRSRR
jgi:hypothetical protein